MATEGTTVTPIPLARGFLNPGVAYLSNPDANSLTLIKQNLTGGRPLPRTSVLEGSALPAGGVLWFHHSNQLASFLCRWWERCNLASRPRPEFYAGRFDDSYWSSWIFACDTVFPILGLRSEDWPRRIETVDKGETKEDLGSHNMSWSPIYAARERRRLHCSEVPTTEKIDISPILSVASIISEENSLSFLLPRRSCARVPHSSNLTRNQGGPNAVIRGVELLLGEDVTPIFTIGSDGVLKLVKQIFTGLVNIRVMRFGGPDDRCLVASSPSQFGSTRFLVRLTVNGGIHRLGFLCDVVGACINHQS